MLAEALSFKVSLDFIEYLKKTRLYATNIVIGFWDNNTKEFMKFGSFGDMLQYYEKVYNIVDVSSLGSLCYLQSFSLSSDLYEFPTQYIVNDILGSPNITPGSAYDIQRNEQRKVFIDRQTTFIKQSINEYVGLFNQLKVIYSSGVYTKIRAIPGWSKNGSYLKSLEELLQNYGENNLLGTERMAFKRSPETRVQKERFIEPQETKTQKEWFRDSQEELIEFIKAEGFTEEELEIGRKLFHVFLTYHQHRTTKKRM